VPDRYLKIVLTVIALELFWIGMKDIATPVSAQPAATRVVITGVDIAPGPAQRGTLPVAIRSSEATLSIQADRPLKIEADRPLGVLIDRPLRIDSDRPIKVENVGYTPARKPGE